MALYDEMRAALAPGLQVAPAHVGDTAEAVEERADALKFREVAVSALAAAFPSAHASSLEATAHAQLLSSLRFTNPWQVCAAALQGLQAMVEQGAPLSAPLVAAVLEAAVAGLSDSKYSAVRTPAAAVIAAVRDREPALLEPHQQALAAVLPK